MLQKVEQKMRMGDEKRATSQAVNCEMEKYMGIKGVRGQRNCTGRK